MITPSTFARVRRAFVLALALVMLAALPEVAPAFDGEAKLFESPRIGSRKADGCYSWPGPCRTRRQANAFCRLKGYTAASRWRASNQVGTFSTKRLGDGGVCRLQCTVLTEVMCWR